MIPNGNLVTFDYKEDMPVPFFIDLFNFGRKAYTRQFTCTAQQLYVAK